MLHHLSWRLGELALPKGLQVEAVGPGASETVLHGLFQRLPVTWEGNGGKLTDGHVDTDLLKHVDTDGIIFC